MPDTEQKEMEVALTEQEIEFCDLFVFGGSKFAGQAAKCHKEVYGEDYKDHTIRSRRLLTKPEVAAHITDLSGQLLSETESIAVKLQVAETLKAVMAETATHNFCDKFGTSLSPAPLRAVSVNAAKALMELYPIKHVHESRLRIEGAEGNVVFNVIVPEASKRDEP